MVKSYDSAVQWDYKENNLNDTSYFDIKPEENSFLLFSAHREDYFKNVSEKLDEKNENYQGYVLDKYFFSKENMEIIQKKLILGVFEKSKKEFLIPPQNYKSIELVMKYIYGKYSQQLPYNITQQISDLNDKIADELVPQIIENCISRQKYIKEISKPPPTGPSLPENVSISGNRTLPSFTSSF